MHAINESNIHITYIVCSNSIRLFTGTTLTRYIWFTDDVSESSKLCASVKHAAPVNEYVTYTA
jgi:hypothetical protein